MDDAAMAARLDWYRNRLRRAEELLREWRDKHGGKEHYGFVAGNVENGTASPTDLLRDTAKFLEGK